MQTQITNSCLLLTFFCLLSCVSQNWEPMKNVESDLFKDHRLDQSLAQDAICRLVEGTNVVLVFTSARRTHFFRTESRFTEEVMVELLALPTAAEVMVLGENGVKACYKAGQKQLKFTDSHPEGTIEFSEVTSRGMSGRFRAKVKNQLQAEERDLNFEFEIATP